MDLSHSLRQLLRRWGRGEVDERAVHRCAERLWEELGGGAEYPRQDPRSIPVEVLSHLEILDQQLVLPEDIPEILAFLDAPRGKELQAWSRWELYWDTRDYDERLERLKDNPHYSKLSVKRERERVR